MKLGLRVAAFVLGVGLLFFGWRKARTETLNLQNPGSTNTGNPSELLVVVGAFVTLAAFVPSSQQLGRWMSLKRKHHVPPAQFRRRRRS